MILIIVFTFFGILFQVVKDNNISTQNNINDLPYFIKHISGKINNEDYSQNIEYSNNFIQKKWTYEIINNNQSNIEIYINNIKIEQEVINYYLKNKESDEFIYLD